MSRVRKMELLNPFMHLCKDMGKKAFIGESDLKAVEKWGSDYWTPPCEIVSYKTVGAWRLDYAGCYGGWVIQEIDNEGGGISNPFGARRHKAGELLNMIYFARQMYRLIKQKEGKANEPK